jgi:hypothetical protein
LATATRSALAWGWRTTKANCVTEKKAVHAIYLNTKTGGQGDSFAQFKNEFIEICATHHKQARALAFAFILYDFEHPQIAKMLDDRHYWNALNKISGRYLTVFAFRLTKSSGSFDDSRAFIKEQFGVDLPEANPSILFFQVADKRISDSFMVEIEAEMFEPAFIEVKEVLLAVVQSVENVQPEFRGNTTEIFDLIAGRLSQRRNFLRVKKLLTVGQAIREVL